MINRFSGTLPEILNGSRLDGLAGIEAYANAISGTVPASWSRLSALVDIQMHRNELSGTMPTQWARLTNTVNLHLGPSDMAGTLEDSNRISGRFVSYQKGLFAYVF